MAVPRAKQQNGHWPLPYVKQVISPENMPQEMSRCKNNNLPMGIEQIELNSQTHYADHFKKDIQPRPPPDNAPDFIPGWARFIWYEKSKKRRLFYYHRRTNCYQWENPELLSTEIVRFSYHSLKEFPLPTGWVVRFVDHPDPGRKGQKVPLFINDDESMTTWYDPRVTDWKIEVIRKFLDSNIQCLKVKFLVRDSEIAYFDAATQIAKCGLQEFHSASLMVRYYDQLMAFDCGALAKQLFNDICLTLQNQSDDAIGMFSTRDERDKAYHVCYMGGLHPEYLKQYFIFGKILGLMMQHRQMLNFDLSETFALMLLKNGELLTEQELMALDYDYRTSYELQKLELDKNDPNSYDELAFEFRTSLATKYDTKMFYYKDLELEDGVLIVPYCHNLDDVAELMRYNLRFHQVKQQKQMHAIINGLKDTIPFHWFRMFNHKELIRLICGSDITIEPEEMLAKLEFDLSGFDHSDSPELSRVKSDLAVSKVKDAIRLMSSAEIRKFVQVISNIQRLPPEGVRGIHPIMVAFTGRRGGHAACFISSCSHKINLPVEFELFDAKYQTSTPADVKTMLMQLVSGDSVDQRFNAV